jgi:tetratricopeptide (TPR) repeat protein
MAVVSSLMLALFLFAGQTGSSASSGGNGQSSQSDLNARFNRAVELQNKGLFKEAESEYRGILKIAPSYAEALANLGAVLIRQDKYQEGIRCYEEAYRLAPSLKPILLNIGIAHYRQGEFAKAVEALKRFLAVSPGNQQATQLTAFSLLELGRDEEALTYLEKAAVTASNDPAVLYAIGFASLRLKRPMVSGAIKALEEVPGGMPASYLLRGQASLMNTQWEKAIVELEEARKLNPNLARLQYSLGLAYLKAGRDDDARRAFEAELRRSPRDVSTLWYLAYMDEQAGKYDDARKWLASALATDPGSADANALLGRVLLKQGKAAEALKPLELAVAKDPDDGDKHFQLARAYQQLGRKEDATRQMAEYQRLKTETQEKERSLILKP